MKQERGLIFDFDNTLVHADAAYRDALAAVDIDASSAAYQQARKTVKHRLGPLSTQAHNRLLYFKSLHPTYSAAAILDLMERYERALAHHIAHQWHALGRANLLNPWAERYMLIILTNENTRTQLLKWRAIDPDAKLFSALISSEEVGHAKPNSKMFAAACQMLQRPAQQCMMVGDSLHDDVVPALAWGMKAFQTVEFLPADAPRHADPTRCLLTLAALDRHL